MGLGELAMSGGFALGVIIALSVGSLIFIGNGITGMVVADNATKAEQGSSSIYIGLIILMALVVFILTIYEKWIIKQKKIEKDHAERMLFS